MDLFRWNPFIHLSQLQAFFGPFHIAIASPVNDFCADSLLGSSFNFTHFLKRSLGELADGSSVKHLSSFVGLLLWPVVSVVMPMQPWGKPSRVLNTDPAPAWPFVLKATPPPPSTEETVSSESDGGEYSYSTRFSGEGGSRV